MKNFRSILLFTAVALSVLTASAQAGLQDGLLGYYPFNPGDAIGVDSSGNGRDGVLGGSPLPVKGPDIVKNPEAAAHFVRGGYVDIDSFRTVDLTSYSIVTWFQLDELSLDNTLVARGPSGPLVSSIGLMVQDDELIGEHEPDGINGIQVKIPGVEANRWYGAAFTYDATDELMKLYLSSCILEKASRSGIQPPGNPLEDYPLVLGANGEHHSLLAGSLDEVRIYDRALTESEVTYLLTGCVPEPATLLLLGLGGLGLLRRRKT